MMSQQYEGPRDSAKWEKAKEDAVADNATAQQNEDPEKTSKWENDKG